jgi:hypothetical protein
MVDVQTISIAIASGGVFVAAVYYILQLRHQSKVRETDLAIRLNPVFSLSVIDWQQAAFKVANLQFKDFDDFVKKYGSLSTEKQETMAIHTICNFFEGIGLILKRNLVSAEIICDYWGESAIFMWEKLKPLIEGFREQYNMPRAWKPFEYLYNEMQKREQQLAKGK